MSAEASNIPTHVAVIMDGNGRWARARNKPRHAGHRAGVRSVRATVEAAAEHGVGYLTLFAFSSENWRRPEEEVSNLMSLFVEALRREVAELHRGAVIPEVAHETTTAEVDVLADIEIAVDIQRNVRRERDVIVIGFIDIVAAVVTRSAT